jgi:hypothetical protein
VQGAVLADQAKQCEATNSQIPRRIIRKIWVIGPNA